MRVLVIGGGLGGLCLAQGLRRGGAEVEVFERDPEPHARRQGYRLHVDTRADAGLSRCLPPRLYELFRATTSRPSRRVTVLSEQLRTLRVIEVPGSFSASVDRLTLREILLAGLGDVVRFGARFTRFEMLPGGRVRAHFADGRTADGDVLVGADGAGSAVRAQYLPRARLIDTGVRCLYGRTPLAAVRDAVPGPLWDGFCPVTDRRRLGLALGLVEFQERPAAAAARLAPDVRLTAAEDYVMWCLSGRGATLGRDPDPAGLVAGWHPDLRELIAKATPAATFALSVRSSLPCRPWAPSPVTVLGDAIHAMAPSRGSGANLALLDAGRLCDALTGPGPLTAAIGRYEKEMTRIGFAAVRASTGRLTRWRGRLRASAGPDGVT